MCLSGIKISGTKIGWSEGFFFYYTGESVLLGTKPLIDSIRHFIWDLSGIFSVCHPCECCIVQWRHDSRLLLLSNWSPYNETNITRWLEDMNFMFSWQEQCLTHSLRTLMRYCSCHSNIKFISSRHGVISSIYVTCLQMSSMFFASGRNWCHQPSAWDK